MSDQSLRILSNILVFSVFLILAIPIACSLAVSYKPKQEISIDREIALLGIYPGEIEIYVHIKTCTQMFKAIIFV